jgi:hypothetical protein
MRALKLSVGLSLALIACAGPPSAGAAAPSCPPPMQPLVEQSTCEVRCLPPREVQCVYSEVWGAVYFFEGPKDVVGRERWLGSNPCGVEAWIPRRLRPVSPVPPGLAALGRTYDCSFGATMTLRPVPASVAPADLLQGDGFLPVSPP